MYRLPKEQVWNVLIGALLLLLSLVLYLFCRIEPWQIVLVPAFAGIYFLGFAMGRFHTENRLWGGNAIPFDSLLSGEYKLFVLRSIQARIPNGTDALLIPGKDDAYRITEGRWVGGIPKEALEKMQYLDCFSFERTGKDTYEINGISRGILVKN